MEHLTHRIGIDLSAIAEPKSSIAEYVQTIATALEGLQQQKHFELIRIDGQQQPMPLRKRITWQHVRLPMAAMTRKLDTLFVPAFSAPRFNKPVVMAVHDLYALRYPDQFTGQAKRYWVETLPQSAKRAHSIIAPSEYVKEDIISQLGIDAEKITVVPGAAAPEFRIVDDADQIASRIQRMGITPPFIVAVGALDARKNYDKLIDAFAFSKRGNHKLVIVGKPGNAADAVAAKVRKYHLQEAVIFLDGIEREDLVALYNACTFYISASVYEGFGLQTLQAMQCGAAVMVSQNTALPEIVGDAGMVFDPFLADDIRKRMDLLFADIDLRREMQQASVLRSRAFSLEESAAKTAAVLLQACKTTS